MQRLPATARADSSEKLEQQGLSFHDRDSYWNESACYAFTAEEIDTLESATKALHDLAVSALQFAVDHDRLGELGVSSAYRSRVAESLQDDEFSLYGRMDLAYDGTAPPRLLEYNADTPTSLLEAAVCQWFWLQDCRPGADQFNSIHERLISRWRQLPGEAPVHLACMPDHEEDWACVAYLADTVTQAGRKANLMYIDDVGWDAGRGQFVDGEGEELHNLFKLYPWEWMQQESFGPRTLDCRTRFIEPAWKGALSCKGLLPLLWELNPGHPNLLPAFRDAGRLSSYARKPVHSREGANILLVDDGHELASTTGPYDGAGYVYQALAMLPCLDGHYPVIGSWIVGGEPAGIGIREDSSPITTDQSRFVPHFFTD
jgi:glutathionylspermidine synthase